MCVPAFAPARVCERVRVRKRDSDVSQSTTNNVRSSRGRERVRERERESSQRSLHAFLRLMPLRWDRQEFGVFNVRLVNRIAWLGGVLVCAKDWDTGLPICNNT